MNNSTCEIPEIERLLKAFISFKSVADLPIAKQECLDWICNTFLEEKNSELQKGIYEDSPWIYVPHPGCKLLIFAHCDVVPAPDELFNLRVDGDKALGRGTSDMKGNILPFLMAYRDALKEGIDPPISLLITTDEEVAGTTIPHLLHQGVVSAPVAFTPDSNDTGIVCEHKGVVWSELVATGKGGHGAYPWETDNPVWKLAKALQVLQENFPPGSHDDWQITVSPTMLKGSDARNQVSGEVTCAIDIRFPPEECSSAKEALEKVSTLLPEGCELREVLSASPLNTDQNHPMVSLYKEVASQVLGVDIPFKREHGGTDARYFSEKGIPAFLYGPAGGEIHSDDEWVSLTQLSLHYEVYRELFQRI